MDAPCGIGRYVAGPDMMVPQVRSPADSSAAEPRLGKPLYDQTDAGAMTPCFKGMVELRERCRKSARGSRAR